MTTERDLRVCSIDHLLKGATVISPIPDPVSNREPHVTRTIVDCYTGAVLSVTDPNGAMTCTQYDRLGRVVETAVPGDTLSLLAEGTRDPGCPTSGQTTLGSSGQGRPPGRLTKTSASSAPSGPS